MLPEQIGRYTIKAVLGRGGMATVYHAYDPNFERDVAIKLLPQIYLDDPQIRTRFEREAKMIALLEHPAIVPVYDFGEEKGQPFIVMRYMAGDSLSNRIKHGALSPQETSRIISRLAPALDAAHANGIVHRDLKPGNILFDQYGNAFLSDFGIARLAEEGNLTLTGENVIGTPAYMSPEQVQGDRHIDGRSDIYSLGVLIFQMLTGQAPYRDETAAKVMMMHILQPIPNIRELDIDLPKGCENVIATAMSKDPEDRYATTVDLANALEQAVRGEGVYPAPQYSQAEATLASAAKLQPESALSETTETLPVPGVAYPQDQAEEKPKSSLLLIVLSLIIGITVIVVGLSYLGSRGSGPLAILAPATSTITPSPTNTPTPIPATETQTQQPTTVEPDSAGNTAVPEELSSQPTQTTAPSETLTTTPEVTIPVIGGADMIAFLKDSDIWVAHLDGSNLRQLTVDGGTKIDLQWSEDGQAINYISGKCVHSVGIVEGNIEIITCFNYVDFFTAFQISPEGARVAISLDNQLYLVPNNADQLSQVKTRSDLTEIAECKELAPYERSFVKSARWSNDGNLLAVNIFGVLGTGKAGDIVQVLDIKECVENPKILDNFPPPRFEIKGYDKVPVLQNFDWDGDFLFALNSTVRNDGFGDLYIYNMDLHKARLMINPIDDRCCYRDPHWSPDGSHIVFAYQDYLQGANSTTQLYYIPYGSVGTGTQYSPLPLPEITNSREKPFPILRPAIDQPQE